MFHNFLFVSYECVFYIISQLHCIVTSCECCFCVFGVCLHDVAPVPCSLLHDWTLVSLDVLLSVTRATHTHVHTLTCTHILDSFPDHSQCFYVARWIPASLSTCRPPSLCVYACVRACLCVCAYARVYVWVCEGGFKNHSSILYLYITTPLSAHHYAMCGDQ